jgi:hypothetical protein
VLAADAESSGGPAVVEFTRVIVMPDGQRYIEGVTPKQLLAPAQASADVSEDGRPQQLLEE